MKKYPCLVIAYLLFYICHLIYLIVKKYKFYYLNKVYDKLIFWCFKIQKWGNVNKVL